MYIKKLESSIFRRIGDKNMLALNTCTGESTILNETGRVFLEALDGNVQNIEDIMPSLALQYEDMSIDVLRPDFIQFMQGLESMGLVRLAQKSEDLEVYHLANLHIEITMKCNERCIHCYIPNHVKDNGQDIPYDIFCKVVDDAKHLGVNTITLSGGEPMLHKQFVEMLEYCNSSGVAVNLFSNLTLLNDEHIRIFQKVNINMIQVSVYSMIPEVHDSITQRKKSLEKTLRSIQKLRLTGIPIQIACPVMKANSEHLDMMLKYVKDNDLSLRLNSMLAAQADGNDSFVKSARLNPEEKRKMLSCLIECDAKYTYENLLEINLNEEDFNQSPASFLTSPICSAGIDHCCITSNGDVIPCPDWIKYKLGNIYEEPLSQIWINSRPLKRLRYLNKQRTLQECLECNLLKYCNRCFVSVGLENGGDMFHFNKTLCDEANIVKQIAEGYK